MAICKSKFKLNKSQLLIKFTIKYLASIMKTFNTKIRKIIKSNLSVAIIYHPYVNV